jgi:hypothetical protein
MAPESPGVVGRFRKSGEKIQADPDLTALEAESDPLSHQKSDAKASTVR